MRSLPAQSARLRLPSPSTAASPCHRSIAHQMAGWRSVRHEDHPLRNLALDAFEGRLSLFGADPNAGCPTESRFPSCPRDACSWCRRWPCIQHESLPVLICWPCFVVRPAFMINRLRSIEYRLHSAIIACVLRPTHRWRRREGVEPSEDLTIPRLVLKTSGTTGHLPSPETCGSLRPQLTTASVVLKIAAFMPASSR